MDNHSFHFDADSEVDTQRLGAALADVLPAGAVVGLTGELGAGKTRLVQAIASANGAPPDVVNSPTFVLMQIYPGRRTIYHFDAYRLRDEDEFLELGPDEYFEADGLTFVEWSDRVATCLPVERLDITIIPTGLETRRFTFQAHGPVYRKILSVLRDHTVIK